MVRNRPNRKGQPRWYVRVWDPGRGRHVEKRFGRTKAAAERKERQWLDEIDELGTIFDPILEGNKAIPIKRNPELHLWVPIFLETFAQKTKTYELACSQAEMLVEFFGNDRLSGITSFRVAAYQRWRRQRGHRKFPGRPITNRTINMELELLRRMWNRAREARLVFGDNPVKKGDLLPEPKRHVDLLSEGEYQALLDACTEQDKRRRTRAGTTRPALRDLVEFLRHTGCRVGEALNLRVEDVNKVLGEFTFRETKNTQDRTLPLLPHLDRLLAQQEPINGYYFGGAAFRNSLRIAWEKARTASGLGGLHLHDFRHMAKSWMKRQRADHVSNAYVLGHKIPGMDGYYSHAYPDAVPEALEKLAVPFPQDSAGVTRRWQDVGTGTEGENVLDAKSAGVIEL